MKRLSRRQLEEHRQYLIHEAVAVNEALTEALKELTEARTPLVFIHEFPTPMLGRAPMTDQDRVTWLESTLLQRERSRSHMGSTLQEVKAQNRELSARTERLAIKVNNARKRMGLLRSENRALRECAALQDQMIDTQAKIIIGLKEDLASLNLENQDLHDRNQA